MARQRVPVQLNQFIGGLNTEANPLSFPINSSIDENNCSLLKDGSRRRRLGFDLEPNYQEVDTNIPLNSSEVTGRNQFRWENPGGFSGKQFLVVQIGNYVGVHDLDNDVLSNAPVYSYTFPVSTYSTTFGFAVVDGSLTIATGLPEINIVSYDGSSFTRTEEKILVRDFFGVEAIVNGVELTSSLNGSVRPTSINDEHLYNLRNQTFALPKVTGNADNTTKIDPVNSFFNNSGGLIYPSNNDNTTGFINPNPNFSSNRTVDRLRTLDMVNTTPGTGQSSKGYFIIDVLERGASRLAQEEKLRQENTTLNRIVTSLPEDKTEGGASVIAQYASRIWYAGFGTKVTGGDKLSPKLGSYIMFSQVVNEPSEITRCYQAGDPTSNVDPDIVATDGGFIKLDGAFNIVAMVNIQDSLFVFAENGVWQVQGSDDIGFTATAYQVRKLGTEGCISPKSVIRFEQSIMFWGESAIYAITQNEVGGWSLQDISRGSIQSIYDDIPAQVRSLCVGYYDFESDSFRWLYDNNLDSSGDVKELVFNTKFGVFTKNSVSPTSDTLGPLTVSGGQKFSGQLNSTVTANSENVLADSELVTVPRSSILRETRSSFYLVVLSNSPTITYTFGGFSNENPLDWVSLGDGVDNPAYLISGPITGGDARLQKELPYITTYFMRTEDEDLGDVESSCFVSSRWNWTTSVDTSKWSRPRQVYRPQRVSDGHDVVSSKSRIRGRGRSVSINFESEVGKTFRLYGWEHNLNAGTAE